MLSLLGKPLNVLILYFEVLYCTFQESPTMFGVHCSLLWLIKEQLPWWRHHMEAFSALLALCAGNSPVTSEFPSHFPHRGPVTRSLMFHLMYAGAYGWTNAGIAGDLRRHDVHCDITLMIHTCIEDLWLAVFLIPPVTTKLSWWQL